MTTTPQEALSAMRNLGVTLNDYDSTALETLCNFAESQIAALSQQAAQEQARADALTDAHRAGYNQGIELGKAMAQDEAAQEQPAKGERK